MNEDQTYEDGILEGRIQAIEAIVHRHDMRFVSHSDRLRLLERALWITLGIVIAIQFIPEFFDLVEQARL